MCPVLCSEVLPRVEEGGGREQSVAALSRGGQTGGSGRLLFVGMTVKGGAHPGAALEICRGTFASKQPERDAF